MAIDAQSLEVFPAACPTLAARHDVIDLTADDEALGLAQAAERLLTQDLGPQFGPVPRHRLIVANLPDGADAMAQVVAILRRGAWVDG